jgi:hypothetical protein
MDVKFLERIPGTAKRLYKFTAFDDCTRIRILKVYDACNQRTASDPVGISGWLCGVKTEAQANSVRTTISGCADHAESAIRAEAGKNYEEANRQWNIVFNGGY